MLTLSIQLESLFAAHTVSSALARTDLPYTIHLSLGQCLVTGYTPSHLPGTLYGAVHHVEEQAYQLAIIAG